MIDEQESITICEDDLHLKCVDDLTRALALYKNTQKIKAQNSLLLYFLCLPLTLAGLLMQFFSLNQIHWDTPSDVASYLLTTLIVILFPVFEIARRRKLDNDLTPAMIISEDGLTVSMGIPILKFGPIPWSDIHGVRVTKFMGMESVAVQTNLIAVIRAAQNVPSIVFIALIAPISFVCREPLLSLLGDFFRLDPDDVVALIEARRIHNLTRIEMRS